MDEGLDTGPVLARSSLDIEPEWTAGDLYAALRDTAPDLLLETLRRWAAGEIDPIIQDEKRATHCAKISAEAGAVDWTQSAERIARMMRAYQPWPGVWCKRDGKRLGLIVASSTERDEAARPGERLLAGTEKTPSFPGPSPSKKTCVPSGDSCGLTPRARAVGLSVSVDGATQIVSRALDRI